MKRHPPYPNMQKQRVSRACDTCKRRKIRCTGKLPCAHCIKNKKTCEFKAAYTRGAVPEVQSAPVEEQEKYLEEVGYKRRQVWRPSPTRRSSHVQRPQQDGEEEGEDDELIGTHRNYLLPCQTLHRGGLRNSSPGASSSHAQHTRRGNNQREINANTSAGASLYEQTQSGLHCRPDYHHKNPVSAYGDAPLPKVDASFLVLPSENTARALVRKYFDFVSATNRILHQPTVETWTSELLSNIQSKRTGAEENSRRAVVLMVFASTYEYMSDECGEYDADTSFYYFQAAENQLAKETGEIRLATLQARLIQCMYLLSRSRINQCYSIFGTVVNFVYVLELHRERRPSKTSDLLEIEIQKRVFWSTYVTDKYLSSALGRPQMLRDEDIDQQIPLLVGDENLSSKSLQTTNKDAQTPMKGVIFQIRLVKIISNILHELYSIQKISLETRLASAGKLDADMRKWRSEIAHFLDLDPSLLSPLYRRQNMALRLSYAQARIILHRPFLFDSFDGHLDIAAPLVRAKLKDNVNRCLDAALDVVKTIDAMYKMEKSFNASWFAHYVAYTATVALFVHVIKSCTRSPIQVSSANSTNTDTSTWMLHFNAATKCQEQIKNSSLVANESFARKCSIVLEELKAEVVVKIRQVQNSEISGLDRGEEACRPSPGMGDAREEQRSEPAQMQMEETSFFGGEWNDMNFDQSVHGGGNLFSVFNGLDGIRDPSASGSLVDKIDRWGFSSLTGY